MPPPNSTVHIIDDDLSVQTSLARLMRSAGLSSETFSSAEDYLKNAKWGGPLCLILDVRMKGLNGLDLQNRLTKHHLFCPIIFLTGHGDIPMSVNAMKNGAHDFFTKPVDDDRLLKAVFSALDAHANSLKTGGESIRKQLDELTEREFEVMRCVIGGAMNKQIATHLGISEKTVKTHRGRVMVKLGIESVADLVRLSIHAGIDPIPM